MYLRRHNLMSSCLAAVLKRVKKYDHLVLSLANDDPDCPLTVVRSYQTVRSLHWRTDRKIEHAQIVNSSQGDVDKKSVYQV